MSRLPGWRALRGCLLLLVLVLPTALVAAEDDSSRRQNVLLPLPAFWQQLAGGENWSLLPLERYEAALAGCSCGQMPQGAWIEDARIQAVITADRRIEMHAELTVVAAGPSACRCPVYLQAPFAVSQSTLDDHPALWLEGDRDASDASAPHAALTLLVPTPGRHHLSLTATSRSQQPGERLRLPLPIAGSTSLVLHTDEAGLVDAQDLERQADGSYLLIHQVPLLDLGWEPGLSEAARSIIGVHQQLEVSISSGARPATWSAELQVALGTRPGSLVVALPAGWVVVHPTSGVSAIDALGPEESAPPASMMQRIRLTLAPGSGPIGFSALLRPDAVIALPAVQTALWQDGYITVRQDEPCDFSSPVRWQRLASPPGTALFSVPGNDAGMVVSLVHEAPALQAEDCAWILLGRERWRQEQRFVLHPGPGVFSLRLHLPATWHVLSLSAPFAAGVPDSASLVPGSDVDLAVPHGSAPGDSWVLDLVLERPAGVVSALELATLPGATELRSRVVVAAAAGLDLQLDAHEPWRLALPGLVQPKQRPTRHRPHHRSGRGRTWSRRCRCAYPWCRPTSTARRCCSCCRAWTIPGAAWMRSLRSTPARCRTCASPCPSRQAPPSPPPAPGAWSRTSRPASCCCMRPVPGMDA